MSTTNTSIETELSMRERAMILGQAMPLWKSLCASIRQNATERSLKEHRAGVDQVIIGSKHGHIVLTLSTVPKIQFEVYRNRRQEIEEPEIKDSFTFELVNDRVWLTTSEGEHMNDTQASEYLLDLLTSIGEEDF